MNFPCYILITVVILLLLGACQKFDDSLRIEEDPITLVKRQFQQDSIAFALSGVQSNYNFRQSLGRQLDWSRPIAKDSLLYVPLKMVLPDGMFTSDGSNSLPNKAWLVINKGAESDNFTYKMMTLFSNGLASNRKFSGIVFLEDYFLGDTKYAEYFGGEVIPQETRRSRHGGDGQEQAFGGEYHCEVVRLATVCVGDVNDGNAPPICGGRYERRCEWIPGEWQLPLPDDDGVLGPGSGGGGGNGPTDIKNRIIQPCLKAMVDQILAEDIEFTVDRTLKSIFDVNSSFNLTFTQTNDLPALIGGLAIGRYYERLPGSLSYDLPIDYLEVEIRLNANTLPNASQEYIVMVILHESVHAYLYSQGLIGGLGYQHHNIMWTNYVDFIAQYLMDKFDTPQKDAYSLAREGLQQTSLSTIHDEIFGENHPNDDVPSAEREAINQKYRLGTKGQGCTN